MDARRTEEIWSALLAGRSPRELGLPTVDGRVDLRGIEVPKPRVIEKLVTRFGEMTRVGGLITVERASWSSLDFSGAALRSLRFFDSRIENCRFDGADPTRELLTVMRRTN